MFEDECNGLVIVLANRDAIRLVFGMIESNDFTIFLLLTGLSNKTNRLRTCKACKTLDPSHKLNISIGSQFSFRIKLTSNLTLSTSPSLLRVEKKVLTLKKAVEPGARVLDRL